MSERKWYSPVVDAYNATVDTVTGWFDDDTKEAVKTVVGTVEDVANVAGAVADVKKAVSGDRDEEKTGFLAPPPINLDKSGRGRYQLSQASTLNALGFASEDMRRATNNMLRSQNPTVRREMQKAFKSRAIGPTIKLAAASQIAPPKPRPRPNLKKLNKRT